MTRESIEIYWKDLLKKTQKRIKAFYDKNKVTGLESIYASEDPILILMVFEDGDFDTSAADGMVS